MQGSNESKEEEKRKKGRAKGGIITGTNKELKEIEYNDISDNKVERKIVYNDKTYRVMVVYNQDMKGTWKEIEERVDGREEEVMIIGGDWNARTGEEERPINEDLGKEIKRQDNKHGRKNSAKVPGRESPDDNQWMR